MSHFSRLLSVLGVAVLASAGPQAAEPHNPFGVPDVIAPDGKDVQAFAAKFLSGGSKDPNAEQWVKEVTAGKKGSIEGEWLDRWNGGGGTWNNGKSPAQIKVVGDRVFILVNASNGKFLIDLKRDKDRLVGKYQGIDNPSDTGPCVFLVVDDERLDGNWAGAGRWDFRRKLK